MQLVALMTYRAIPVAVLLLTGSAKLGRSVWVRAREKAAPWSSRFRLEHGASDPHPTEKNSSYRK